MKFTPRLPASIAVWRRFLIAAQIAFGFAASFCVTLAQAETTPSADVRFAKPKGDEVPSFQRHVVPLLGQLGCNGRACHGSFQGQGGFRLSLFGYDFAADHLAVAGGEEPRVKVKDAAASLLLRKPTLAEEHEGGRRLNANTWQYHLLRRWIQAGAPATGEDDPTFVSLEVEPQEIVFAKSGDTATLRVFANWSDGSREDVTPLARFRSNDESMAKVDSSGKIVSTGKGDTHVVAFYDNGVIPVQIFTPVSELAGKNYPAVAALTKIDELITNKLRKLGVVPSEVCTDAEFLRRVSLDITGTLPASSEVKSFLADTDSNKRAKKIESLLERPSYSAWWATRISDYTGNTEKNGPLGGEQRLNGEKSRLWYLWIQRRVENNTPYDKLVEGIAKGIGRQRDQSFEDFSQEMGSYFRKDNPADFAARETMPFFWARRTVGKPEDRALSFAYSFLGVSLQCAQCHKHPFDQWTKQDFDQFTQFFVGIRYGVADRKAGDAMKKEVGLSGDEDSGAFKRSFVELVQAGKLLPFKDLTVPRPQKATNRPAKPNAKSGRVITPKLLGGEEVIASEFDDPRDPVIDWMRQDDNPYFARSFVNRVWANYFHVGLIDPTDDLNLANPPSNPEVLDYLAQGFIKHNYDMKWLHREITNSHAYQRSWRSNATNPKDERNFSRAVIRRLPGEVAYDAVQLATASDTERQSLDADPISLRAIGASSGYSSTAGSGYAVGLFGKPPRTINCDCDRSNEPSLLQSVYLRNDQEVLKRLSAKGGWLKQLAQSKPLDIDDCIREVYLRTVSRYPDENEMKLAREHIAEEKDPIEAIGDVTWALLNTKEFTVNH